MIGIAVIHTVLILLVVYDLVGRQSRFIHKESTALANGLAQTLATNSVVWSLAKDYAGLQELVSAQLKYSNIKMAMVYDLDGKILAHTDKSKVGFFIDEKGNSNFFAKNDKTITIEGKNYISSVKAIESNGQVFGKAWVLLSEENLHKSIKQILFNGVMYTVVAIAIGVCFAVLVTKAMTKRLKKLVLVADAVKKGERNLRAGLASGDELSQLSEAFDSMLDSLESKEKKLLASRAEAKAANQAKTDFLANMSHELRTPINTMVGLADILAESKLSDEQKQFVEVFQKAGQNLTNLVNDILDLSKVEAGKLKIKRESFSLEELFANISLLFSGSAAKKQLQMEFKLSSELPKYLVGDSERISQVLLNFISNAIKFTEKGKITVTALKMKSLSEKEMIYFSVEDTGMGIREDQMEILFGRYQQVETPSTRKIHGTGLGLAISKKLVEGMQGEIGCESKYAVGSKFFFTLPLEEGSVQISSPLSSDENTSTGKILNSNFSERKILLVDDAEDNRLLIKVYLKYFPLNIIECQNGQEAVEKFINEQFDIVLLDLRMPVMNGYEAVRLMREWETKNNRRRTPIFALSADSMPELIEQSLTAGCDGHLSKPIRKNVLLDMLKENFV